MEYLTRHVSSRHQRILSKRRQRSVRLIGYASLLILVCVLGLAHSQTSEQQLTLEAAADRKSDLQDQLQRLDHSGLSDEEVEAARIRLGQLLTALTTFEEAVQRRDTFRSLLQSLPLRLDDALAARTELENRRPSPLPEITEALRADYEARRQFLEAEVNGLTAQTTSGGVRLAGLPAEIQEVRASWEKLLAERHSSEASPDLDSSQVTQTELLDTRMQGHRVDLEGLEAERQWLIERGPLHDALLHVARLRLKHVQEDLHKIQTSLAATIQAQRASSGERLEQLQVTLDASTSPAARIYLQVRLDTERTRQRTADYQRQLNGLRKEVHLQENLNNQVRQDASRLLSLAEQYGSGEQVAQRLLLKFEHLRRERNRLTDNLVESLQSRFFLLPSQTRARPLDVLELRMRNLNDALFAVDDRLYEFDRFASGRENQLTAALFAASPSELVGAHASLRSDLDVQRAALREQQQVLADLTQTMSALMALRQEHARLLDEGYQLALSRMLWLKDRAALSWTIFGDLTQGRPVTGISQCRGDTFRPERSLAAHEGKRRTLGAYGTASGRTSADCQACLQAPEPHPPGRPGGFGAQRGIAWRRGFASAGSSVRRMARVSGSTWLDTTASGHAGERRCSRDGGACLGALSVRCNTGNRFVQPVTVSTARLGTAVLGTRQRRPVCFCAGPWGSAAWQRSFFWYLDRL